ncbi:MAG: flagellar biosynthesis protein FlhB [Firmicutes bacterium]|nr:flagellar biosynthesis protein FlhB [Bacillota bacterium]
MADQNQAQEKTEHPTPRKLQQARKKGQVAKSRDLAAAVILVAMIILAYVSFKSSAQTFQAYLTSYFRSAFDYQLSPEHMIQALKSFGLDTAILTTPVFIVAVVMAILANIVQVGFLFAPEVIKPKAEKINPVQGLKRIFSLKSLVELLKSVLKVVITATVVYLVIRSKIPDLLLMFFRSPTDIFTTLTDILLAVATAATIAFFILSVFDLMFQRFEHTKNLKMTKQEVKDEMKQSEGDPHLKSWLKRRQREIAMNQIREEVPEATVVVTNPQHFAVALQYLEEKMPAPMVTAKGAGYLAQKIKEIAAEHEVPVIRQPELARALYHQTEPGQEIPAELYQAVAEIIATVYKLDKNY